MKKKILFFKKKCAMARGSSEMAGHVPWHVSPCQEFMTRCHVPHEIPEYLSSPIKKNHFLMSEERSSIE